MALTLASNLRLISEEFTPGRITLVSAKEGPLGATYRLSFGVEVLFDPEDLDAASEIAGVSPEQIEAPDKKETTMPELIAALQDDSKAPELYNRMENFGIEDVVEKFTPDDFIQLLHFLIENKRLDLALKLKRPNYWSNITKYINDKGEEQQVMQTDLRAGTGTRGTDAFTQKALHAVWETLADQSQDVIVGQVVDLFAEVPPQWQKVIFGNDFENVSIQLYKGNEKFNNPETVGHEDNCECPKCKKYKGSWHHPYRTSEEMQNRQPYAYDVEKWQQKATEIKRLIDKLTRKARKAETAADKEYCATRIKDLMAKGQWVFEKMEAARTEAESSAKRVLFVYVIVDMERFVRTLSVMFRRHLKRQNYDESYAKSTILGQSKNGQQVEVWQSGLSGFKDLIIKMGQQSHDNGIYDEIIEVIEDTIGTPVVDLDNNGNIIYIPYDTPITQQDEVGDIEPMIHDLLREPDNKDGEKGGHESDDQPTRLSRRPTWMPMVGRPMSGGGREHSESIERIAEDL